MIFKKKVLVVILVLTSVVLFGKGEWKLVKRGHGINVYSRAYKNSKVKELKATAVEKCPFKVAVEIIKDANNYCKWFGMTKKLYVIKKRSEHDYDMYFVLDTPVVKNRDVVVHVTSGWDLKKNFAWVKIKSFKSDYKKKSGCIRMPEYHGKFIVTKINDKTLKTEYILHAEVGGVLPGWLANMVAKYHPYKTGLGLQREIKNPKYYKLVGLTPPAKE